MSSVESSGRRTAPQLRAAEGHSSHAHWACAPVMVDETMDTARHLTSTLSRASVLLDAGTLSHITLYVPV